MQPVDSCAAGDSHRPIPASPIAHRTSAAFKAAPRRAKPALYLADLLAGREVAKSVVARSAPSGAAFTISTRGGGVIAGDLVRIILAAQRGRLTRPVAMATPPVAANHATRPPVAADLGIYLHARRSAPVAARRREDGERVRAAASGRPPPCSSTQPTRTESGESSRPDHLPTVSRTDQRAAARLRGWRGRHARELEHGPARRPRPAAGACARCGTARRGGGVQRRTGGDLGAIMARRRRCFPRHLLGEV